MAINSYSQLVEKLNKATEIAVEKTAKELMEKLKEFIQTEYYDLYEPLYYRPRTYMFLNSAVYKMLSGDTASIGIDDDYFDYNYPARYTSQSANENLANIGQSYTGHWTGEDQAYAAEYGMHGNANIYTDGHYWSEFIEWCNSNCVALLRKNLIEQGVPLK